MKVHLVLCKLNLQLEATVALRAIAQCLAHALVFQPLYVCCPARSVEPKKRILKLFDVFFLKRVLKALNSIEPVFKVEFLILRIDPVLEAVWLLRRALALIVVCHCPLLYE